MASDRRMLKQWAALCLVCMPLAVFGNEQDAPSPRSTPSTPQPQRSAAHYLDEMAVMDAHIQYLRKEGELRNALAARSNHAALPKVVSIVGDQTGTSAQLLYDSGIVRWLRAGDVVVDGLQIKSVAHAGVIVGDERTQFSLPFVSSHRDGQRDPGFDRPFTGLLPSLPDIYVPRPLSPVIDPQ